MISQEVLIQFADRGNQKALHLIEELNRFEAEIEAETNSQINQIVADITHVLSRPDAITQRDTKIPSRVIALSNEWGKLIDPTFGVVATIDQVVS